MRRALLLLALVLLAACQATAGPTPAQQYQAAAERVTAALADMRAAGQAAGQDPALLGPIFVKYADALREFNRAVDQIVGSTEVETALAEVARSATVEEIAFRAAASRSTYAAMNEELAAVNALQAAFDVASTAVKSSLGLP